MSREEVIVNAFEQFDNGNYDAALKLFIAAHELSNDEEKRVIVDQLFSCFVLPNIDEFKAAYEKNLEGFLKFNTVKAGVIPEFKDLRLTFYPATGSKCYIYDNDQGEFAGDYPIDLDTYGENNVIETSDSILFDSIFDFREVWPEISIRQYKNIYFVLNDKLALNYFFCFMMVPGISDKLGGKLLLFDSHDEFKEYLLKTGESTPKVIKNKSGYDYDSLIEAINMKRNNPIG